ncbi:MAG: hypothetical protein Q4G46_15120, partial [Propionibacteriaceae bacterium]|nr:hypothetical protein [Propionibacteriaceae bacterium]
MRTAHHLVVGILALLLTLTLVGIRPAQAQTWNQVVADTFSRSVTSGWGDLPTGGKYTMIKSSVVPASVANGTGNLGNLTEGRRFIAMLPPTLDDVRAASSVTITAPTGTDLFHTWRVRDTGNGSWYAITYRTNPSGEVILSVSRVVDNKSYWVHGVNLPYRVASGHTLNLEVEVTGTSPVTVLARAWQAGTTPPDWQLKATDKHASRLTAPGLVGLDDFIGIASSALTLNYDNILVQTPVATSAPTATAPAPAP